MRDIIDDLCKLHDKMLSTVQAGRPYPVSVRLDENDTWTILTAALELEKRRLRIEELES